MISYSARRIFKVRELELQAEAERLVASVPTDIVSDEIRCHELTRAVGRILDLQYQDGFYGFVDHTWLWTTPFKSNVLNEQSRLGFPNILDVYSVGSLPMVRLVDAQHTSLPHVGWAYRPHKERDDIRESVVETLVKTMRAVR